MLKFNDYMALMVVLTDISHYKPPTPPLCTPLYNIAILLRIR